MIRVLQVLGTTGLGGAESRVMDLFRHMNREEIMFDFLVSKGTKGYYEDEIESLGGKIYYLPRFVVYNLPEYVKAVKAFFEEHKGEYAAVHGHMTSTAAIYLPIAKKAGVPLTIAHARSAGVDPGLKGMITRILRKGLSRKCDIMLTCSNEAGVSVFGAVNGYASGKKVEFVPNAIDTGEFSYNQKIREEIREKYGLTGKCIIGHVGSFRYAKNHEFLIEVFARVLQIYQDNPSVTACREPHLMLLGDGELRESIADKVASLAITDNVTFTGNITPVAPFYQAFDALLFPSNYEGMPGTVVEAQAAGLPSLISDRITPQVGVTPLVTYMSLDDSIDDWADKLINLLMADNDRLHVLTYDGLPLGETLYDVNKQVIFYNKLYANTPK